MYEWGMNDVYMVWPPKIVIVLGVLPNWNKIVNQSIDQSLRGGRMDFIISWSKQTTLR